MRVRLRFVVGAAVIVTAVAYLIITAIRTTSEYYLTVNEVSARQATLVGQRLRVAGRVKAGTISWAPDTLTLKFAITPMPDPSASAPVKPVSDVAAPAPTFRVICTGEPKPDMFKAGRDVIVEGKLLPSGEIAATQVLTSCPSKYRPNVAK
jgi:cytochrome c-type biogenesis protein CcmE